MGNAAVCLINGEGILFSHSRMELSGDFRNLSYTGPYQLVELSGERHYEVFDTGNNIPREMDTEAKFFEYIRQSILAGEDIREITILSEKHMCASCAGVMQQFMDEMSSLGYNVQINVISGREGYNSDAEGKSTWKGRESVK